MKKDFIRDNGKIRLCPSNLEKMNPFEYAGVKTSKKEYLHILEDIKINLIELGKSFGALFVNLVTFLFLPIVAFFCGFVVINQMKKEMTEYRRIQYLKEHNDCDEV